jgi:hypothetical protein
MSCRAAAAITAALLLASAALAPAAGTNSRSLSGTWCLKGQDLSIAFLDKDSVRVTSSAKNGVNGAGRYTRQDTMFVATVQSSETTIRMGYRYEWQSDTSIMARLIFMTVDGDSVALADSSVSMRRCGPAIDSSTAKKSRKKSRRAKT